MGSTKTPTNNSVSQSHLQETKCALERITLYSSSMTLFVFSVTCSQRRKKINLQHNGSSVGPNIVTDKSQSFPTFVEPLLLTAVLLCSQSYSHNSQFSPPNILLLLTKSGNKFESYQNIGKKSYFSHNAVTSGMDHDHCGGGKNTRNLLIKQLANHSRVIKNQPITAENTESRKDAYRVDLIA